MIAYDGLPMPKELRPDAKTKQQIHIYVCAFFSKDGRTFKLFRHDLGCRNLSQEPSAIERSLCA